MAQRPILTDPVTEGSWKGATNKPFFLFCFVLFFAKEHSHRQTEESNQTGYKIKTGKQGEKT